MFSKLLNIEEVQTLFKLRTRTIDVKKNQESSFKDNMWCKTCYLFTESQEHIFECQVIRKKLSFLNFSDVEYKMIFGRLKEQEKFAKVYQIMLNARADILKNDASPSSTEDPCTSSRLHLPGMYRF